MRDRSDPFTLADEHFIQLFRLNKQTVRDLFDIIGPHMVNSQSYKAVHPMTRVFVALIFYATGTYQRVIGQSFHISVSQQSVARCIEEVTSLIINHLADRLIVFPTTDVEKNRIKEDFMINRRFPGVIGAIDCSHIALLKPAQEEHNYLNRKGYHSKNVQIVCCFK